MAILVTSPCMIPPAPCVAALYLFSLPYLAPHFNNRYLMSTCYMLLRMRVQLPVRYLQHLGHFKFYRYEYGVYMIHISISITITRHNYTVLFL